VSQRDDSIQMVLWEGSEQKKDQENLFQGYERSLLNINPTFIFDQWGEIWQIKYDDNWNTHEIGQVSDGKETSQLLITEFKDRNPK
jgi:hypothetical protein